MTNLLYFTILKQRYLSKNSIFLKPVSIMTTVTKWGSKPITYEMAEELKPPKNSQKNSDISANVDQKPKENS